MRMALGNRTIMTSADGTTWTEEKTPDPALNNNDGGRVRYYFSDIFGDGKQYIVSGEGKTRQALNQVIWDGKSS